MLLKRLGVALLVVCCTFLFTPAFAAQYDMDITSGMVYTGGNAVSDLNSALPLGSQTIPGDFTAPGGSPANFDIAGYWEVAVTGSTQEAWNQVFAGGSYRFDADWSGALGDVNFNTGNTPVAFADMYAQWYENNPYVYTYFSLYVDPTSPDASDPNFIPTGIFAFVADSEEANFDNIDALMGAQSPVTIAGGTGTFTATPEPATMLLFGLGLLGLAGANRKKK